MLCGAVGNTCQPAGRLFFHSAVNGGGHREIREDHCPDAEGQQDLAAGQSGQPRQRLGRADMGLSL